MSVKKNVIPELSDDRMQVFKKYLDKTGMQHHVYQYEGVQWTLNNELRRGTLCNVRGGIIADEMGLGKTIMMIGTFLANFVNNTLIVVPPVLIDQWYQQIYKTTGHKSLIYHGKNKKSITLENLLEAKIVITTYGAVTLTKRQLDSHSNNATLLHQVTWGRIVFDEAHHLRNKKTSLYMSVRILKGRILWLVTGTPIQNKKKDLYNLLSIIKLPATLYTDSEKFKEFAPSFILKRTKKQIGLQMSDVIVSDNMVPWKNKKEMMLSKEIHSELAFSRVSASPSKYGNILGKIGVEKGGVLPLMIKAKQSCVLPRLIVHSLLNKCLLKNYELYKEAFEQSSKLDFIIKMILERKDNGSGKLVFCHFKEEIDEIALRLRSNGVVKVATFDGRTSHKKRLQILHEKNEVLILQIQTGCEGLNLQENYSEIYFVSPHWNPAIEDQAIARCHRIGQKKEVSIQRFEMSNFLKEGKEGELDTMTIDNYASSVQSLKRLIASETLQ
jgi:non-specific serine/threonine protein kinase